MHSLRSSGRIVNRVTTSGLGPPISIPQRATQVARIVYVPMMQYNSLAHLLYVNTHRESQQLSVRAGVKSSKHYWPIVSACHADMPGDHRTPVGSVNIIYRISNE